MNLNMTKKGQQRTGFFSTIIKIIIGLAMLYAAYLLFRYAFAKGDWEFILAPLRNLIGLE